MLARVVGVVACVVGSAHLAVERIGRVDELAAAVEPGGKAGGAGEVEPRGLDEGPEPQPLLAAAVVDPARRKAGHAEVGAKAEGDLLAKRQRQRDPRREAELLIGPRRRRQGDAEERKEWGKRAMDK